IGKKGESKKHLEEACHVTLDKVKEHFAKDAGSIYYNKPLTSIPFTVDISNVSSFVSALAKCAQFHVSRKRIP
ncbi:MAG: hypothetical protein ABSE73_13410, partial [Planctomycetota bacterium]